MIFDPHSNIIVCGDFNFNCLNDKCKHFLRLCTILSVYGLQHRGGWPSRITDTTFTCIDHIFTNINQFVSCVYDNTFSDHRTTLCDFQLCSNTSNKIHVWKRSYSDIAIQNFQESLLNEAWTAVYHSLTLSSSFDAFFDIVQYYFHIHFPLHKSFKGSYSKNWVSLDIRASSSNLKNLYYVSQMNPGLRSTYQQAKKCIPN
nr:unnamed protein product [Callosobruchus chinensis]